MSRHRAAPPLGQQPHHPREARDALLYAPRGSDLCAWVIEPDQTRHRSGGAHRAVTFKIRRRDILPPRNFALLASAASLRRPHPSGHSPSLAARSVLRWGQGGRAGAPTRRYQSSGGHMQSTEIRRQHAARDAVMKRTEPRRSRAPHITGVCTGSAAIARRSTEHHRHRAVTHMPLWSWPRDRPGRH